MTTAPTNEMLALADELDAKLPVFHGRERDLIIRVVTALRLAATPARDVREALDELLRCANAIVGADPCDPESAEAFTMFDQARVKARRCLALSNLDAAAPAADGDAEPVAWRMLFAGFDEITTDKAKADRFRDYVTVEPLYAAPPLQAPAHSDAVREALRDVGAFFRVLRRSSGTLELGYTLEVTSSDYAKARAGYDLLKAALTAPAAKAPAVSEADVDAAEIAGLVTAAAKVIADWSADCKVDDDSIVALLTAYNAMKPCGALLLNEVESAIQSAAQGGGTEGGEG